MEIGFCVELPWLVAAAVLVQSLAASEWFIVSLPQRISGCLIETLPFSKPRLFQSVPALRMGLTAGSWI